MDATPPAAEDTSASLLARAKDPADQAAWRRLHDLYRPLIGRWLRQAGVPPADADDLGQDVLGVLLRELPQFAHAGRRGAFRCWLRGVVANRVRGFRRGRKPAGDDIDLDALADPDSGLGRAWDREHDEFVIARLMDLIEPEFAPATWAAFRRQMVDGLSAAAAAEELGVSVNAVLIAKSRVLRRLRREAEGLVD